MSPTVVVARRPVPGREREFERWLRRLSAAAERAPGHLDANVQPPGPAHPDEWVTRYRFDTAEHLDAWLGSDERNELLADGGGLVLGETREQRIAIPDLPAPVTAVASYRIVPGLEQRYDELHGELMRAVRTFPGFARSERFDPVPGVQEDTVIVFSFDTRQHLDAWLQSDVRAELIERISVCTERAPMINVLGGFAGWFDGADAGVRRWKQAAAVLLALYPTSLLLTRLRMWLLPDIPWMLGVLFANVLGVIVLSWVLMPVLTARLARWLRR